MFTPGRRVHGKFSIHEPCEATGSIATTLAHVRGAFHQLWKQHSATRMIGGPLERKLLHGAVAGRGR